MSSNIGTPQQQQPLQVPTTKKASTPSNKKPKHSSSTNTSTSTNTSSHSEPPFPLYPTVVALSSNNAAATTPHTTTTAATNTTANLEQGWNSVVQLLRGRKRIAILTGAGMSVSCGIPDFRTKGSGLYSTLDTAVRFYIYHPFIFIVDDTILSRKASMNTTSLIYMGD